MVIDEISKKYNIKVEKENFNGLIGKGEIDGEKVILVKPQTYMNLSGECVAQVLNFYKIEQCLAHRKIIIILYDLTYIL